MFKLLSILVLAGTARAVPQAAAIQACLAHPQASSYQYNSDGWCGCLSNSGDSVHTNANAFSDTFSGACALCAIDHMSQNVNTNPFGPGR